MIIPAGLSQTEKRAFGLHVAYSLLDGIILGIIALNEFVFIKSLRGSDYQLGILFQFSMVVFIFLIFTNEFIRRTPDKARLLRRTSLLTRLPLLVLILFPGNASETEFGNIYHWIFLLVFLMYYFGNVVIYPLINQLLKRNYRYPNFGRLYALATSAGKIMMLLATFVYGLMLDADPGIYRWVLSVAGLIGVLSVHILSMIPLEPPSDPDGIRTGILFSVRQSVTRMVYILRSNRPFLHYQVGFMFYGFAFMSTVSVITLFFEKGLQLSYSSVAFYKNGYNILAIILLPFTGRWLGTVDPRRFAALTFSSLLFYLLFMILTGYYPAGWKIMGIDMIPMLGVSFVFYGIFAGTMPLAWNIGSSYFCSSGEAADYQALHLSLTAVRALFAPLFGIFLYKIAGFSGTFLIGAISLIAGIVIMSWSQRIDRAAGPATDGTARVTTFTRNLG